MSDNEEDDVYNSEEEEEPVDSDEENEVAKPKLTISKKVDVDLAKEVDSDAEVLGSDDEGGEEDGDEEVVNKVLSDGEEEDDDDDDDDDGGEELEPEKVVPKKKSSQSSIFVDDGSDEGSDNEDDDDHYLQKFNEELNRNYLVDFHPECVSHNYEEIAALSVVVRDKHNNIIDDLHKTLPYLTKYEKSRIIGQRAKQINSGAKTFVKVPENVIDGYLIAEIELMQKRLPFIIRRPIFGNGCEYWCVKDLENIGF